MRLLDRQPADRTAHRPDTGWLACVRVPGMLQLAWVQQQPAPARPLVRWVHEQPLGDDLGDALRAALRPLRGVLPAWLGGGGRWPRHRCVALLGRNEAQLLPMDPPEAPRAAWRDAVRWKLKDMVDFAVDDAGVDLLEMPPQPAGRRQAGVIAVVAPAAALRGLIEAGQDADVEWAALDVAETALRHLGAMLASPGRGHALLHVGPTHGTLAITCDGVLLQSRQIDITDAQLAGADEAARQAAFDRASLELQRSLDGFERSHAQVVIERLHVLPGPGVAAFCDHVRELLYVPVLPVQLADVFDLQAVPALADEAMQARLVMALAAALRGGEQPEVNLYDDALRPRAEPWRARHAAVAVALTLGLGWAAGSALDGWAGGRRTLAVQQEQQTAALRQQVAQLAPDARLTELEALRRLDAGQRRVQDALRALGGESGYTPVFHALSRQTHPSLWLTGLSLGAGDGSIELRGRMLDAATLPDYLRRLNQEALLRGRRFEQLEIRSTDAVGEPAAVTEFVLRSRPSAGGAK